ncbi:MAG TPA: exodeoxyribonuclease VII large subunit [Xanthobacteraceae bacterium]|nr:exodeoxyribonuclease VII large subunit [Xanthobacteraceae bacterium]
MRVTETIKVASTEIRTNLPEVTVSELSLGLKRVLEDTFGFVRVRGELGKVTYHSNGHVYLDLKDDKACIAGVIWRSASSRIKLKLEMGLEVVATGRITTYAPQSKYQLVIESIEPAGAGALMALLEERKKKLKAEGLFDEARKKPLPYLPRVIGVVTSPTGAVIRDILHRLTDRFPRRVLVWPVRVQGETCAPEVAAAIEGFNALQAGGTIPRPDVLIVARGGGSLEDLWGFNEEIVARAAAASEIPLISAVGHETDFTLIDFVSDRRAPTPTAAAELAVPVRAELLAASASHGARLSSCLRRYFDRLKSELRGLARGVPSLDAILAMPRQRLDALSDRLPRALRANAHQHRVEFTRMAGRLTPMSLRARLERLRDRVHSCAQLVEAYSYHKVLNRGFALVRDAAGVPIRAAAATAPGAQIDIEFSDGRIGATVNSGGAIPRRKSKEPAKGDKKGGQGGLFD